MSDTRGWAGRFFRQTIVFAIFVSLFVYFMYDAVRGTHGLIAKQRLSAKVQGLQHDLSVLKMQRARMEKDAELLSSKVQEQPALLDEEARSILDLAHPADIVIVNGSTSAQ